jgi:sugar lactone lactonase YvrE
MWVGAQIIKWDPTSGNILEQIDISALHKSSCVFGGKNMNELYITSARQGLDDSALNAYPLSGGVFRLQTKSTGMPTFKFGG